MVLAIDSYLCHFTQSRPLSGITEVRSLEKGKTNIDEDACTTRQSVAVQRDGASRLAKKIPIIALPKCVFELFLLQKWP